MGKPKNRNTTEADDQACPAGPEGVQGNEEAESSIGLYKSLDSIKK